MDLQDKIVQEYLATGCGYRKLQAKYGISRNSICKWVQIYQHITPAGQQSGKCKKL